MTETETGSQTTGTWIQDLPKPPVPNLHLTLERYLAGLKPVLPSAQYQQTEKTVEDFLDERRGGEGLGLQRDLEEYACKIDNWVTDLWMDDMYLNNPIPLPINSNPFYLIPKQTFRSSLDQLKFGMRVLQFCHDFKHRIHRQELSQEYGSGHGSGRAFCMETYENFFGSCRIPSKDKDSLWTPCNPLHRTQCQTHQEEQDEILSSSVSSSSINIASPSQFHRIIVASRNQFFLLKLSEDDFKDETLLLDCLRCISFLSKDHEVATPSVGLLTTENRRTWGSIRSHMINNSRNRSSIEAIETSEYILCLDDSSGMIRGPGSFSTSSGMNHHQHLPLHQHHSSNHLRRDSISRIKMDSSFRAYHLLTGGGTDQFTGNRWYDKFMNFVVGREGVCGLVIEHTGSEGITITRFLHEFLNFLETGGASMSTSLSSSSGFQSKNNASSSTSVQRSDSSKRMGSTEVIQRLNERKVFHLKFDLDDVVSRGVNEACKKIDKLIDDLDLYVLQFKEFGKTFIKQQSMSPDAFIQIALQLTHYKVHRRLVSSYESAGLRQYRHGRVDNIRSCTMPVLFWAQSMCDEVPDVTEDDKVELFQKCMEKQVEILKYTISGNGPDNHLMALKEMGKRKTGQESGGCLLFKEKSYKEYLNFRLSTSQLPSREDILIGYGPVVPDGYGCSYNPCPEQINFCISSFYSSPETSSDFFARSLEGSLLQMREICLKIKRKQEPDKTSLLSNPLPAASSTHKTSIKSTVGL